MNAPKEKFAIIISTKDRRDELMRLLGMIAVQKARPDQVVVVDGGKVSLGHDIGKPFDFPVDYVRFVPASLPAQRNAGIRALRDDIALVFFLDDDILLEDDALENMMAFWKTAPDDVWGAGFNNTEDRYGPPTLTERVFLVNADSPGRILRSGFQSKLCSLKEAAPVEWLPGYGMTYRRSVFEKFGFDEWFSGYARYEDVDFSYRVSRGHKLFLASDAKVRHPNRLEDLSFSFRLGRMEFLNRLYFVRKNKLSVFLCAWALFGIFVNNVLKGAVFFNRRCLLRAGGSIAGLWSVIARNSI
ncbi:MAG: glycosyltransferase [Candidatus Omnitrophota bacterium]